MIKVLDVVYEEGNKKDIEDVYVCDEKIKRFAVIDGDSGFGPFSGLAAADTIRKYMLDKSYENDSLEHIAKSANIELRRAKRAKTIWDDLGDMKKYIRNCCSVAAIQIRDETLHYLQMGNCMIFVQYQNGTIRSLTYDHTAKIQEKYIQKRKTSFYGLKRTLKRNYSEKKLGQCYENALAITRSFRMQCCESFNTYEGYGMIDGSRETSSFWEIGKIPLMDVKKIALVTDGFQLLSHKLPSHEKWMESAKYIFNRGLKSAYTKITLMEKNDPYCQQFPRVEWSDDKTGILLEVLRS
ncbi:PP2C family serine/threonine-protein phosphatase [Rummeliibacillus pycnus]|uniref:PP2C family serine/threonine-protein phosphatase n=1 Tax=Rummeliibacillus pycnus TaxID=101070 RepID=UPI000C9B6C89|nr:PP2C family serine/threonine-protein phosphatase [Rummeliibacillus pycnus]